jgi:hypothetical protein
VLVCSLTLATALLLRSTGPDLPQQTVQVASLVLPASMYVDERVAARAIVTPDGAHGAVRKFHMCYTATGECVRTSRGSVPLRDAWTGFAGWVTPREAGTHVVELVLHEDWGVDSQRATTRVSVTLEALERAD